MFSLLSVRACVKKNENDKTFSLETSRDDFSRVLLHQSRQALRSEPKLLQSLINRKLFMRNGDVKILTPQETWDLITNLVEKALSPPEDDEEDDGI